MSTSISQPHLDKTDTVAKAVEDVFRARPGVWLTRTQVDNLIPLTDYSRSTLQRAFNVAYMNRVIETRIADEREFRLVEGRQYGSRSSTRRLSVP
jgi:hypothetical protein